MSTWQLDPAHTVVSFTGKHMMITKVRGIFKGVTGTIEFDEANPVNSRVEVVIPAATVETGVEPRDNHLRSADFLDAESYPTLTFVSTGIAPKDDRWAITGDLTIRGVTREVVLDVEYSGQTKDPWGNVRAAFTAKTSVDRKDFGLTWNQVLEAGGVMVGDRIDIEIEVEAVKQAATKAA